MPRLHSILAAAFIFTWPSHSVEAGPRAFVSSTGSDANFAAGCTFFTPCRSFQAGHNAVDAGGEVIALDSAGYGSLVILKSVTVMANPGVIAQIQPATFYGIQISTPGLNVALRDIHIHGNGTPDLSGVDLSSATSLSLDHCAISGVHTAVFIRTAAKVRIRDTTASGNVIGVAVADNATVDIVRSQMLNNSVGVEVGARAGGKSLVSVTDSVVSGNNIGFFVLTSETGAEARLSVTRSVAANNASNAFLNFANAAGSTVWSSVTDSMVSGNGTGFENNPLSGTALFESLGNNFLRHNMIDKSGTITTVAGH
jgi:hypothetical protein